MEEEKKTFRAHCLVLSYPTQGHVNPMLQFSKRLVHKAVKVTLVTTRSFSKTVSHKANLLSTPISWATISDGYDEGGISQAESIQAYLDAFFKVGSETLTQLIEKLNSIGSSVDCIVYDAFLPWALDVAKKFELVGAVFFTQSCAVDAIYYHLYKGLVKIPLLDKEILLPGLPPLEPQDFPSLLYDVGSYPAFFDMVLSQFSNIDKVDWVLCNTFYELEEQETEWLAKQWRLKTIGPTIPSMYLDKQIQDDVDYGFSIFKPINEVCMNWLKDKPKGSVVYASFGSLAALTEEQMEEIACGLKRSNTYFLWVVRASEEVKLPVNFKEETKEKGLIVTWCPQLEVISHEAIGCFLTHCGWNSTLEALSLGVPMVGVPQWTDQSTNAKYIMDFWKMGIRAPADEKGVVRQEAIEHCINEIMQGEIGKVEKVSPGSSMRRWKF